MVVGSTMGPLNRRMRDRMRRFASLIALSVVVSFASVTIGMITPLSAMAAKHNHHKPAAKSHKTAHETTSTVLTGTTGRPTCPTLRQAETALGGSYGSLVQNSIAGGGILCEYTGGVGGNAGVAIYAHESAVVFAGMVAHAPGAPAMPPISGIGNGAFGMTAGGRSVVNAYSNASRTVVAAQAPGALAPVEALARVALSDN
jgi:hypothetical protein